MAFNAEEFLKGVTWEVFDELKKPDLMALATYLGIEVKHSMRKPVIKNMLIDHLVADDLLDEECLENKIEILDSSDSAVKLKQLEIQEKIEMAKLQMKAEQEEKERQERLQLEKEKLQIQEQERQEKLQLEKEKLDLEKALKQQELDAKLQFEQKEREDRLAMEK